MWWAQAHKALGGSGGLVPQKMLSTQRCVLEPSKARLLSFSLCIHAELSKKIYYSGTCTSECSKCLFVLLSTAIVTCST